MKSVTRDEAERQFKELLEQVTQRGDPVTIEEDGQPVAVVTPFDTHERRQARRRFLEMVESMQQRSSLSAEEADELAREAVDATRERLRLIEAAEAAGGSLKDVEIPGWESEESTLEWVRNLRMSYH